MSSLPTPLSSPRHKCTTDLPRVSSFTILPEKKPHIPPPLDIFFKKMLKVTDGRDKTLKTCQYLIKILSYHHHSSQKWLTIASQFSLTRQILCLGNAYEEIQDLFKAKEWRQRLLILNSVINAISDDIYCLYRLGILRDKRWAKYSDMVSVHCWFISIVVGLRKNYYVMCQFEGQEKSSGLEMARVNVSKSIADALFCGCDVFHPSFSQGLQAYSGFASAVLAMYKIYKSMI